MKHFLLNPATEAMPNYKALIETCVRFPPLDGQGRPVGFDTEAMRKRIRILDALDKATADKLSLEDADHAELVRCLKAMRWNVIHRELLAFEDYMAGKGEPDERARTIGKTAE